MHWTEKIASVRLCAGSVSAEKGGTGGGGWGQPQGDIHMVAARLGCERAMVGTGWATSSHRMDRLTKHHSHLVQGWFLARKAAWALSRCMTTDNADYSGTPLF